MDLYFNRVLPIMMGAMLVILAGWPLWTKVI